MDKTGNQGDNKGQKNKGESRKITDVKRDFLDEVKKAKENLINGKTVEAIDIAFKGLMEHKEELGGEHSILILPGLFVLAEGYISEGNLKKAEEYLIGAYWNFLKYNKPEEGEEGQEEKREDQQVDESEILSYRGTLHKIFSKLYLAQFEYAKALDELKASIYMDSEKYGSNHIITALNYYQMGKIFLQKAATPEGEAFYGKTAEIFYKYFKYYFKQQENYDENGEQQMIEDIDQMIIQEAYEQQTNILGYFTERYQDEEKKIVSKPIIDSQRSLALMYKYLEKEDKYQFYIKEAIFECMMWKGDEHPKTLKLKEIANQFGGDYNDDYQQQQMGDNQDDQQLDSADQQQYQQ